MCKFKAIAAKYSLKQMADNGLLSSTKAIIKCLVISSPEAMTLQRLQADYRESEGREIPYVQLGFGKLEEFLMSIPDVVSVYRDCQILKVRCAKPSGESNSKHIYDLVTHQKKTSTRSNRRRTHGNAIPPRHRRSPPILSQSQPSPMFSLSSPFLPPQQNFSFAPVSPLTMQYFHPMNSSNNQYNAYSHSMLNKFYPNVPAPAFHQSQYINSANEYQKLMQIQHNIAQINRAHQNFQSSSNMALNTNFRNQKPQTGTAVQRMANSPIQKAPTECVSINNLPANIKSIERLDTTSKTNSPSATETSSSVQSSSCISGSSGQTVNSSSSANKIPIIIHTKELPPSSSSSKTAIQTDKNVNMNSVVAAKEIPKPLKENNSYSAPMLRNWNSKKRNVDNLRRVSFDTTDECNNLQAESIEMDSIADLSVVVSDFNITDSNTSDFDGGDEAIPALAEDDIIFQVGLPKDVLRLGTKIAVGKIPDTLVVNSLIPIFVTEIHSPYKFWFHIYSETKELDRLMNNMEHFYKSLNGTEYRIKPQNLRIGQVCAALYLRLWHRGEVVGINEDKVKIYFLDYGTTHDVHMKEVNYLLHEFSELPSQAYRGCLDYIKPVKIRWERDATFSFLALVNDLLLYAKVTNINNEERLVHMILTNTNEAKDIQINEALICKGYAKYFNPYNTNSENGSTSRSKRHFSEKYPTFKMIEIGTYPSFAEIGVLISKGLNIDALLEENYIPDIDMVYKMQKDAIDLNVSRNIAANSTTKNKNETTKLRPTAIPFVPFKMPEVTKTVITSNSIQSTRDNPFYSNAKALPSSMCSSVNVYSNPSAFQTNLILLNHQMNGENVTMNTMTNNNCAPSMAYNLTNITTQSSPPTRPPPGFEQFSTIKNSAFDEAINLNTSTVCKELFKNSKF